MRLTSKETDKIIEALAVVSAEIPVIKAQSTNQMYDSTYTGLGDLLTVLKPILHKHGIWTSYSTRRRGPLFRIELRFHHVQSKQHYGAEVTFDVTSGAPHEIASLMTYGRRYLLQLALNLEHGVDDDGNAAQGTRSGAATSLPSTTWEEHQARRSTTATSLADAPVSPPLDQPAVDPLSRATDTGSMSSSGKEGGLGRLDHQTPDAASQASNSLPSGPSSSANGMPATTMNPAGKDLGGTMTSAQHEPPRVNQSKVIKGQEANRVYAEYRKQHGKEKAEMQLQELVGTTYIRLVTPDKYDMVITHFGSTLSSTPAA